jgi:hypothetical protein
MDLHRRKVTLAAQSFYRFGVDLETATGFDNGKIIIPDRHNILMLSLKYCFVKAIILFFKSNCQEPGLKGDKTALTVIEHMCYSLVFGVRREKWI